ncbi:hypothetical protein HNQ60_001556 [Povalibacter uvarum]|uniref:Anti-sigma factor n=1 Tax=Povalibacter uvarum TaxID=732238 RepID=A0A841HKC2_9GAMM|nr:hypothetical protein [Povalibacter uvarum]MBB6092678.1 hypothetical protein [Povalibacter uvarum]
MKFSDEILMAYADGELDAATRTAIEEAMANDPRIAQAIERHRSLGRDLRSAFDPMLDEPMPEKLVIAATTAPATKPADVVSIDGARRPIKRSWSWPEWGAMAASLLIGIVITRLVTSTDDNVVARDGHMFAAGTLANALDQQASGASSESGVHVAITYRAKSGDYCRTFTMAEPAEVAGIACRQGDQWRLDTLAGGESTEASSNYRMAGTAMPPAILQTVQDSIAGEALDAAQEAAARERGWKE